MTTVSWCARGTGAAMFGSRAHVKLLPAVGRAASQASLTCTALLQAQTNRSRESVQSARAEGKFTLPSGRAAMWLIAGVEQLDEEDKQPRVCCRT